MKSFRTKKNLAVALSVLLVAAIVVLCIALPVSFARAGSLSHAGRLPITSGMSPSSVPRKVSCAGSKATAMLAAP